MLKIKLFCTIIKCASVLEFENFAKMYILELMKFANSLYGNMWISKNVIITKAF